MMLNQRSPVMITREKTKRAAGRTGRPFSPPCRSQALGGFSNRASSGGAGRKGGSGSSTLTPHDLVRGDVVGKTAQTGIGLSQDTEVTRRSQSSRDGRTRNSSVASRRVGVTVDVTGAGKPGVQVVASDQRGQLGVLLVLCSRKSDFSRANGAQALEGAGLVGSHSGSQKAGNGDSGNDGDNRHDDQKLN